MEKLLDSGLRSLLIFHPSTITQNMLHSLRRMLNYLNACGWALSPCSSEGDIQKERKKDGQIRERKDCTYGRRWKSHSQITVHLLDLFSWKLTPSLFFFWNASATVTREDHERVCPDNFSAFSLSLACWWQKRKFMGHNILRFDGPPEQIYFIFPSWDHRPRILLLLLLPANERSLDRN